MGKELRRMLVIEDSPEHMADARALFSAMEGLETSYASSWEEVNRFNRRPDQSPNDPVILENLLYSMPVYKTVGAELVPIVDGVITDLFFPLESWDLGYEEPNGLIAAAVCKDLGIPYVVCTAGYHHGRKYEWAHQMLLQGLRGPKMVDCYDRLDSEAEAPQKNWLAAYEKLKELVEGG